MIQVLKELKTHIGDKKAYFVFPSEIVAAFWQKEILRHIETRLICPGRFLSWDEFKEQCIQSEETKRPVNNEHRLLFLNGFLEQNKNRKLFRSLVPLNHADNSHAFTLSFLEMLPMLHTFDDRQNLIPGSSVSRSKMDDIQLLKRRYEDFMEKNSLFEPNFSEPHVRAGSDRVYHLLFPNITKDWCYFKQPIFKYKKEKPSEAGEIRIYQAKEVDQAEIKVFDNILSETRYVIDRIISLLNKGVYPGQIALTVCKLEDLEDFIMEQARLHQVPLYIHKGGILSRYKALYFLRQIKECYTEHFSLLSVRKLLYNKAIPWKEAEAAQLLVKFGVHYRCLKNLNFPKEDVWDISLDKAFKSFSKETDARPAFSYDELMQISSFYKKLKKRVRAVTQAKTLGKLKEAVTLFVYSLFDETAWEASEGVKVYSFAISKLEELTLTEDQLASSGLTDPFQIWLYYMDANTYVKKAPTNKISVYNYRVSAGIAPEYHFVINCSQKGTRYVINNYPYLSINEQEELETPETDLTTEYLNLYAISGRYTSFSFSKKTFKEVGILPGFFINRGIEKTDCPLSYADPYDHEESLWGGESTAPPALLYPAQKQGIDHIEGTYFVKKAANFVKEPIAQKAVTDEVISILRKRKDDEYLWVSATHLELYSSCPYNYFLNYTLNLQEEDFYPLLLDNRETGELLHKIFEFFHRKISLDPAEPVCYDKRENYRTVLRDIITKVLDDYELTHPLPVRPYWNWIKSNIRSLAAVFLETDVREYDGTLTVGTEKWLEVPWEDEKIMLFGKLDRISQRGDFLSVIDYKKKWIPPKADILSRAASSFQLPFYVYLTEENLSNEVESAAYYIIKEGKYSFLFSSNPKHKSMGERTDTDSAIERIKEFVKQYIAGVKKGRFIVPGPLDPKACRFCSYRGICRTKYITG